MSEQQKSWDNVGLGIGLTLLLHLIQVPMTKANVASLFVIGVSQLYYIIPAIVIASLIGRFKTVIGLVIGASITFLLNAACFGLLLSKIK